MKVRSYVKFTEGMEDQAAIMVKDRIKRHMKEHSLKAITPIRIRSGHSGDDFVQNVKTTVGEVKAYKVSRIVNKLSK